MHKICYFIGIFACLIGIGLALLESEHNVVRVGRRIGCFEVVEKNNFAKVCREIPWSVPPIQATEFCFRTCQRMAEGFMWHESNMFAMSGNLCLCTPWYRSNLLDLQVRPQSVCRTYYPTHCEEVSVHPLYLSFYTYHDTSCKKELKSQELDTSGIGLFALYDCTIRPQDFQVIFPCGKAFVQLPFQFQTSLRRVYRQFSTYVKQNSPRNCMRSCLKEGNLELNDFLNPKYTAIVALGEQGEVRVSDGQLLNCACYFVDEYKDIHYSPIYQVESGICIQCSALNSSCMDETEPDSSEYCGGYYKNEWHSQPTVVQRFLISVYEYVAHPTDCTEYVPTIGPESTTVTVPLSTSASSSIPTSTEESRIPSTSIGSTASIQSSGTTVESPGSASPHETSTASPPETTTHDSTLTTNPVFEVTLPPVDPVVCDGSTVKCSATDKFGVNWEGCAGEVVSRPCVGENTTGKAVWTCLADGNFWGMYPNYSSCFSYWISHIETIVENMPILMPEDANFVLMQIQHKYESSKESNGTKAEYYGHEIKRIFRIGYDVLKKVDEKTDIETFENLTYKSMYILGNVFTHLEPWDELDTSTCAATGLSFITNLEESVLELTTRIMRDPTAGQTKYQRSYGYHEDFDVGCGAMLKSDTETDKICFPFEYSETDTYIELPPDWAKYFSDQEVEFAGIQIQSEYVNRIFPGNLTTENSEVEADKSEKIVNGNLISFSFDANEERTPESRFNFTGNGVRIVFQHAVEAWGTKALDIPRKLHPGERPKAVLGSSECVFWDPYNSQWSTEGCRLVESTRTMTVCECFHLTSFALLMDLHKYTGKDPVLEVLTWILSTISIICLIFCIVIFSTSIESSRTPRNEITNHLCIWLLIGNVILLLFMDRHYFYLGDGMCTATGIWLHYAFLTAFMWSGVEGVQLYRMVILVFDDGKDYMVIQRVVAYVLPVVIVAISGITGIVKSEKAYGGDAFCWLEGSYIWAFMVPVAIITLANLILLIVCMRKAYDLHHNPKIPQANKKQKPTTSWVKATLSLCCLLGVTWGFGFLMLSPISGLSRVCAYLFTMFNASQGIMLFIFHGWMNQNVRDRLKRRFPYMFQTSISTSNMWRGKPGGSAETSSSSMMY